MRRADLLIKRVDPSNVRRCLLLPLEFRRCMADAGSQGVLPMHSVTKLQRSSLGIVSFVTACLLAGCGLSSGSPSQPAPSVALSGRVHGGQQPVVGAVVTLYAPATDGYGGTPLAIVSTVSVAEGKFTLPRPFTCPANSGDVYLLATGGDPGVGVDNAAIGLATLVGPCSALTAGMFIEINEVTTVAAAYALAPFATVTSLGVGIGTSATNLLGLNHANGAASSLVDTSTGLAKESKTGIVLPTAEVNTIADILAACINTDGALTMTSGATVTAAPCGTLFTNATPPGGTQPINTFQAAIDIAQNPGNNAANLFGLATPTAPFQPTLPSTPVPPDFALGIVYQGTVGDAPETTSIDIDASGNAWVGATGSGSAGGLAEPEPNTVTEISPYGEYLAVLNLGSTDTVPPPGGVAVAGDGSVYVTDAYITNHESGSYLLKIDPATYGLTYLHPASLHQGGFPAVDNRSSTVWIADYDFTSFPNTTALTTVSQTTFAGVDVAASPYTVPPSPYEVVIDGAGNVWSCDVEDLVEFSPPAVPGNAYTSQTFDLGSQYAANELAIDHSGSLWLPQFNQLPAANSVLKYTPAIGVTSATLQNYQLNAETVPVSVAIDGEGRVFSISADNYLNDNDGSLPGALTVLSNTGTLISTSGLSTSGGTLLGYTANGIIPSINITTRIDASGNVWSTGVYFDTDYDYAAVEVIGVAAPVVTPISVAASTDTLGQRP
jgi:hypothetical protein